MHYALHYSHADSALLTKHLPKYGAVETDECRVGICLVGTADDHLSVCSAERQSADDGVSYQRMEILPLLVGAATQHEPHHTPQPQLRHDLRRLRQRRLLRYRQIATASLVCSARRIALVGCRKPRLCVFRLITCRLRRYQDSPCGFHRHSCHLLFYSHSCKSFKIKTNWTCDVSLPYRLLYILGGVYVSPSAEDTMHLSSAPAVGVRPTAPQRYYK